MRPEKLIMENFGPFSGRVELDFSKLEDIFLISGKTGAGKTTIFDAMCFALYGKVPGSRGDHPGRLRSDHAEAEGDCFVSLEFSLGEKRYTAERRPRYERKKKRGEGTVQEEESFTFCETGADGKTQKNTPQAVFKKSELDAKLKEIIGLEAEEFFKIVLLPQGEFSEFLKQNTAERQKVLGKLFPIEKALKVKELARRKLNDAEAQAKGAAHILEDIAQRVSLENYEKLHAEASAILEQIDKKSRELEKEEAALNQILALRKNEMDAEMRLEESRKLFDEAGADKNSIEEKNLLLSRSRSARPLEQFLRSLENAELALESAETALAAAKEEKENAGAAAEKAEKNCVELPALEKEAHALREKRPPLEEMLGEEKKLKSSEDELERQEATVKKLSDAISLLLSDIEKQDAVIKETEALASEQVSIDAQYGASKTVKDLFMAFRKYRERQDNLEKEKTRTEKETADQNKRITEHERQIPVLEAEIKKLKEEKTRQDNAGMAGHLSAFLEQGKPCPVCGSTSHPAPAQTAENPFGLDERISAQELSLKDAEQNRATAIAALESAKKEAERIIAGLDTLLVEIKEARQNASPAAILSYNGNKEVLQYLKDGVPLPRLEAIDRLIKSEADGLNKILKAQANSREAASRTKELYRTRAETQNKKAEAEKQLVSAEEQKKNLLLRITEGREKRSKLLGSGDETAAGRLAGLDKDIAEKDTLIDGLRNERENARIRLSGAVSAWEGAVKNHSESAGGLKKTQAALEKALSATCFHNPHDAEKALLDPDTEKNLEQEIRDWRENRTALETQIAEQEKQLNGIRHELAEKSPPGIMPLCDIPNLAEAEERLRAVKAERGLAEEEKKNALNRITGLEKDKESLEDAQKRYDQLSTEAEKYKALSDDLWGRNPKKLPFDSWLLGNYLEEAAAYATKRLEKMSESRYSLLLDSERQQSRGYTGLDLMVFDSHTGKTRPCATLSGGESFMASISLALGLADSIQNRSGGVRLDAIFIDEGFGSLDEASLDKALVILDELRDRRMVGLISHVNELRSRIPCKVEVIKTASGSKISVE